VVVLVVLAVLVVIAALFLAEAVILYWAYGLAANIFGWPWIEFFPTFCALVTALNIIGGVFRTVVTKD